MAVQYKIPDYVHISQDCRHLLSRIFVANPIRVWMNKPCLNLTINLYCEDTSYYIVLVDVLWILINREIRVLWISFSCIAVLIEYLDISLLSVTLATSLFKPI
jgi:hypothetical protein